MVVRLGGGRYGVSAPDVAEVVPLPRLTRLPGTPDWVLGVANWRGHVLPLVDLRPLLQATVVPLPSSARVVVSRSRTWRWVSCGGGDGLVEVPDQLDATPVTLVGDAADLVSGLTDGGPGGPVAVLRTDAVLRLRSRLGRPGPEWGRRSPSRHRQAEGGSPLQVMGRPPEAGEGGPTRPSGP